MPVLGRWGLVTLFYLCLLSAALNLLLWALGGSPYPDYSAADRGAQIAFSITNALGLACAAFIVINRHLARGAFETSRGSAT